MQLLLVRHGEPVRVTGSEGPADPGLHERGVRQAELLARYLGPERPDAVYSSPKLRALETAAPLAVSAGLEVSVVEELAEFDRHASWYIPVEEMKATGHPLYAAMMQGDFSAFGIDMAEFRAEVVGAIEGIVKAHQHGRAAVVCHGGVINAYLGHMLGVERFAIVVPAYTSISRIEAGSDGRRTIITLNETGHLLGSDLSVSHA